MGEDPRATPVPVEFPNAAAAPLWGVYRCDDAPEGAACGIGLLRGPGRLRHAEVVGAVYRGGDCAHHLGFDTARHIVDLRNDALGDPERDDLMRWRSWSGAVTSRDGTIVSDHERRIKISALLAGADRSSGALLEWRSWAARRLLAAPGELPADDAAQAKLTELFESGGSAVVTLARWRRWARELLRDGGENSARGADGDEVARRAIEAAYCPTAPVAPSRTVSALVGDVLDAHAEAVFGVDRTAAADEVLELKSRTEDELATFNASPETGRDVWYVAHRIHPTDEEVTDGMRRLRGFVGGSPGDREVREVRQEIVRGNLAGAKTCLAELAARYPSLTFIASYVASLEGGGGDDLDPTLRERGLRDCCRTVALCAGIVLTGDRVSEGMRLEARAASRVVDLTKGDRTPGLSHTQHEAAGRGRTPPGDGSPSPSPGGVVAAEAWDKFRAARVTPAPEVLDQPPPVRRDDLVSVWDIVVADMENLVVRGGGRDADATRGRVLADMRERDRVGRERYGVPLTVHNGRDRLVDLYQELLDAAAYSRARIEEERDAAPGSVAMIHGVYRKVLDSLLDVRRIIDSRPARSA